MAVRTEVDCLTILGDKRGFFVVAAVNGWAKVFGNTPGIIGLAFGFIDVQSAKGAFPVTGEIESFPVFGEASM